MPTTETCFPRGGRIKRKIGDDSEKKEDEHQLFDQDKPKKKAKQTKKTKARKFKATDDTTPSDEIRHLGALRQEDLEPQMALLGRVRQVGELQLLISLPCHLVGAVPATNVSDTYTQRLETDGEAAPSLRELFAEGQYVSCCVVSTDVSGHKTRNTLSVNPSDVNAALSASALCPGMVLQCAVKSEEDNVYAIDCGIPATRTVLPKSALGPDPCTLTAGQVLWCMVNRVRTQDGLHTVMLTAEPGRLNRAAPGTDAALSSQTLLPGMRLPITVNKILSGGLAVSLPGALPAYVYKTQLDEPADCADDYNAGASAHARVLYTLPVQRRTFVTLRPGVARLPAAGFDASLLQEKMEGQQRMPATVLDADGQGVRLLLAGGEAAFVPAWHATRTGSESGKWRRGEEARCVLLGYDAMDELYIASMKKDKEAPVSAATLRLGQRVMCRVRELQESGCTVELEGGLVGFVPTNHLTNVPVSQLSTMFPPGKRIKCRVIWNDVERRRLHLTHNARLVNTGLSLVSEPEQLKRGHTGHWIILKVVEKGLVMAGCSGLSGFVPTSFLGANLKDCFPGQIMECVVHSVRDASGERPSGERRVKLCPVGGGGESSWRGQLASARVTGRDGGKLLLMLDDKQKAVLPAGHLTDVPEHADAALNRYKTGDELEVVGLHSYGKTVVVSAKPLFLEYVKQQRYPASAEEVVTGMQLPCAVVHADEGGVIVAMPSTHLSGTYRIPLSGLADGWQVNMSDFRCLQHRTLMAQVLPNDKPNPNVAVRLSAKLSHAQDEVGLAYLSRCLRELSGLVPDTPGPGDTVSGRLVRSAGDGLVVQLSDGRRGVVPDPPQHQLQAGTSDVTGTVVHVTPAGHLSLLLDEEMQPATAQTAQELALVRPLTARVLRAGADGYLRTALLLPPAPPCLLRLPVRRGLNDLMAGRPQPQPGQHIRVIVKRVEGSVLLGVDADTAGLRKSRKRLGKPAKKISSKDKRWKKKTRQKSQSPGRAPRKPQSAKSIGYSRFSIQDD